MKKLCSKCDGPLESQRIGKQRYCLSCHAAYMRENRPKHSELSPLQRLKANCRAYTRVLLKRGKIKREPCECGAPGEEMHHEDYTNPRKIKWMCRPCHLKCHEVPRLAL